MSAYVGSGKPLCRRYIEAEMERIVRDISAESGGWWGGRKRHISELITMCEDPERGRAWFAQGTEKGVSWPACLEGAGGWDPARKEKSSHRV